MVILANRCLFFTSSYDTLSWTERRQIVRSVKLAQAAQAGLHARLGKAQAALAQVNAHKQGKKVYRDADL